MYDHELEQYSMADGTIIRAGLIHNHDDGLLEAWNLDTGLLAESIPCPDGFGIHPGTTLVHRHVAIDEISQDFPMSDTHETVVTESVTWQGDQDILEQAQDYADNHAGTSVFVYDQGVQITPGTPKTGDTIIWHDQTTTSGGSAVFHISSDRTSGGTAICSGIRNGTVDIAIIDSTGATARGESVITSNKTITVPITRQAFTGVTVLGINVLGTQSMPAAGNGITVKLYAVGVKA